MTGTESTQAFSEGHVEQRLAELAESKHSENRRESHAHAADLIPGISQLRLQGLDTPLIKSTRIVLQDRHGANDIKAWSLLPRGRKGPQTKLEPVHIDSAELLVLPQTASDVGHHIRVECPGPSNRDLGLPLQIVYDASSEGVLVKNDSDVDIWIAPLPASDSVPPIRMVRGQSRSLSPGPWSLSTSPSESPLICFRVLPRAFCDIDRQPSSLGATSLPPAPGSKRGAPESSEATDIGDVPLQKKRAESAVAVQGNDADLELTNALIIEAPPAPPPPRLPPQPAAATPPANSVALRNPFLGLERGSIAHLAGPNESDCYTLVRGEDIAESVHAMVFKAIHSPRQKTESGGKLVVVKVLKKGHSGIARVAELWLAETAINTKLAGNTHEAEPTVARFYGGDARLLSMYMEHIAGRSLGQQPWCSRGTHTFTGSFDDIFCILFDVATALSYVHSQGIRHNDVKPQNIVISRLTAPPTTRIPRGSLQRRVRAVLIDFGLGTMDDGYHGGGTPWYVPPEFMESKRRGMPGDVWALGVVGLFLLGRLSLPGTKKEHETWLIARLHSTDKAQSENIWKAQADQRKWLGFVAEARHNVQVIPRGERSGERLAAHEAVWEMLEPAAAERWTARMAWTKLSHHFIDGE